MSAPPVVAVVPPAASAVDAGAKNAIAPATAISLVSTARPFGRPDGRHRCPRRWSGVMAGCRVGDSVVERWSRPQRDLGPGTTHVVATGAGSRRRTQALLSPASAPQRRGLLAPTRPAQLRGASRPGRV